MIKRIHTVSLILIFITIILSCFLFSLKSYEPEYVRYYEYVPKEKIIIEDIEITSSAEYEVEVLESIPEEDIAEETISEEDPVVENPEYDMLIPSGLTVDQLESGLSYELKPLAGEFIKAEENYGINALHLASIAALESGWGRYQFIDNNIFGFGEMKFESIPHCIDYVASYLTEEYLSEDGLYYSGGSTLYHVNLYYNGREVWYKGVTDIVEQIEMEISVETPN